MGQHRAAAHALHVLLVAAVAVSAAAALAAVAPPTGTLARASNEAAGQGIMPPFAVQPSSRRPAAVAAAAARRLLQEAQAVPSVSGGDAALSPPTPEVVAAPVDEAAAASAVVAAPADEASPEVEAASEGEAQACLDLHVDFGFTCQVGIDRVASTHFPRGSTRPPSEAEVVASVQALRDGGLPSEGCCAAVAAVVPARCGCIPDYVEQRVQLQFQYPTLTPEYLAGVNLIFSLACGLEDTGCL